MPHLPRRGFLAGLLGIAGLELWTPARARGAPMNRFGLHGSLTAQPGQRDALARILLDAAKVVSALPACEIYFVSADEKEPDTVYVTEVWASEADHKASLQMPEVRALIEKGRPMIAGFGGSTRLVPLGGHGLR